MSIMQLLRRGGFIKPFRLTNLMQNLSKLILTSVIVGAVIFLAIGFLLGLDQTLPVVLQAFSNNYYFLGFAVLCQAISIVVLTMRWRLITNYAHIRIPFRKMLLITLSGISFSNLTPSSRMGGEPIRAYFMNKHGGTRMGQSMATIVTERVLDAVVYCIFNVIVLIAAILFWDLPSWITLLLLFSFVMSFFLLVTTLYVSFNSCTGNKVIFWIIDKFAFIIRRFQPISRVKKTVKASVDMYCQHSQRLLSYKGAWFYGVTYSLLLWLFDVLRMFFIFLALGAQVNIVTIGTVLIISLILGAIPLLPGGLGVIESSMIIIYTSSGITLVLAGMATLIDRVISFWSLTGVGLLASYYLGITKGETKWLKQTEHKSKTSRKAS